jgi:hypothetical protein
MKHTHCERAIESLRQVLIIIQVKDPIEDNSVSGEKSSLYFILLGQNKILTNFNASIYAVPDSTAEQCYFVRCASNRLSCEKTSSSQAAVAARTPELRKTDSNVNPKMLILDFKERHESNLIRIQRVLMRETNIRAYSIKMLSRNGISILFRNEKAKRFAAEILLKELDESLVKRKPKESYISSKTTFQVAAILPFDIQPEAIAKRIGIKIHH